MGSGRSGRLIRAQGHILGAVAAGLAIAGSAEEVAHPPGVSARTLRPALRELVAAA